jgi:hypothetical protein
MFLSNKYKFQAERAGEQFKPLPVGDQRYAPNRVIDIPSAAAPTAPPGTVRVALPDGTTGTVPAANLSKWLAAHPGGRQL